MAGVALLSVVIPVWRGQIFDWAACRTKIILVLKNLDIWLLSLHMGVKQSDTPGVSYRKTPSQNTPLDGPPADGAAAPAAGTGADGYSGDVVSGPRKLGGGGSELFHVEQLESEIRRLTDLVGELGGECGGELGGDLGSEIGGEIGNENSESRSARMFAHEVNNLVMGISGRAQRAIGSGDAGHIRAALEASAGLGGRVSELCRVFLDGRGDGLCKSDNLNKKESYLGVEHGDGGLGNGLNGGGKENGAEIRAYGGGGYESHRPISLCSQEVVALHEFAAGCALDGVVVGETLGGSGVGCLGAEGTVLDRAGRVEFVVGVDAGVVVPMEEVGFGQVLLNLYRNAIGGIGRVGAGNVGGVVRMRVMGLGRSDVDGGGVLVRVEDSGVGFGGVCVGCNGEGKTPSVRCADTSPAPQKKSAGEASVVGGGYGLGLDVCRALVGACGGRVEFGCSGMLGGGRVDLVFV